MIEIVSNNNPRWLIYKQGKLIGNASRLHMAMILARPDAKVTIRIGSFVFERITNG